MKLTNKLQNIDMEEPCYFNLAFSKQTSLSQSGLLKILLFLILVCFLSACAQSVEIPKNIDWEKSDLINGVTIDGIGRGFLHGVVLPFSMLSKFVSWIFSWDTNIGLWNDLNNGIRYWIGYIFGVSIWILIAIKAVPRNKKVLKDVKKESILFFFTTTTNEYKYIPYSLLHYWLKVILFVSPIIITLFFAAFTTIKKDDVPKLTEQQVMHILSYSSLEDGAYYYIHRRAYYDFFDELYCDSVVPVIIEGGFMDIKNVLDITKGTPAAEILEAFYIEYKFEYQKEALEKLDSLTAYSKSLLKEDFPTYLSMAIDSILEEDTHKIVEKYAGGTMNYKKLGLLFDQDSNFDKFETYTKEVLDDMNYERCLVDCCNQYLYSIFAMQNEFYTIPTNEIINNTEVQYPKIQITKDLEGLKERIEELTIQENKELVIDIFKDGVIPLVLAASIVVAPRVAVLPIADGIYNASTLGYDMLHIFKDIQNGEISFNDKLELYLAQYLQTYLEGYIPELIQASNTAIDQHYKTVKNLIENKL